MKVTIYEYLTEKKTTIYTKAVSVYYKLVEENSKTGGVIVNFKDKSFVYHKTNGSKFDVEVTEDDPA